MKKNKFSWILFVSRRFANIDRSGRSAITSHLASLGICFGVMTLIIVISVMNGFQMSFIDAIMEVSSYHVRAASVPESKIEDF
nr:ABC transporter permease [Treponema sp.]